MPDNFVGDSLIASARSAFAITKSDSTDYLDSGSVPKALYVGVGGDVNVVLVGDSTETLFVGVLAGTILPIRPRKVMSTGTTASSIIGLD